MTTRLQARSRSWSRVFPSSAAWSGMSRFVAMARRFIASEPPRSVHFAALRRDVSALSQTPGQMPHRSNTSPTSPSSRWRGARPATPRMPGRSAHKLSLRCGPKCTRGVRVVLHPSVFLVASRFPIVTIWENNQSDGENAMIERWRAECRPGGAAVPRGRSAMPSAGRPCLHQRPGRRAYDGNGRCSRKGGHARFRHRFQPGRPRRRQCRRGLPRRRMNRAA